MTDNDMINSIRLGNDQWISGCYQHYEISFRNWLLKNHTIDAETCTEIFQASMVILFEKVKHDPNFTLTSSLKTYLFAIGKNKAFEYLKAKQRHSNLTIEEFTLRDDSDESMTSQEDYESKLEKMNKVLDLLGEPCYSLLKLFYYEKLSWTEIASTLGYSNDHSAKNMKYKCLQKIKSQMES